MTQMTHTIQKNEQDQPSTDEDAVMDTSTLVDPSKPILTLFSTRITTVPEYLRLLIFKNLNQAIASGTIRVIPAAGDPQTIRVLEETGILTEQKFEDLWVRLDERFENWINEKMGDCLYYIIEHTGRVRVSAEDLRTTDFDTERAESSYQKYKATQLELTTNRKPNSAKRPACKPKKQVTAPAPAAKKGKKNSETETGRTTEQ